MNKQYTINCKSGCHLRLSGKAAGPWRAAGFSAVLAGFLRGLIPVVLFLAAICSRAQVQGNFKVINGIPVLPVVTGANVLDTMVSVAPGYMVFLNNYPTSPYEIFVKTENIGEAAKWKAISGNSYGWTSNTQDSTTTPFQVKDGIPYIPLRKTLPSNMREGTILYHSYIDPPASYSIAVYDGDDWARTDKLDEWNDYGRFDNDQNPFAVDSGFPVIPVFAFDKWPAANDMETGAFFIDGDRRCFVVYNGSNWKMIEKSEDCYNFYTEHLAAGSRSYIPGEYNNIKYQVTQDSHYRCWLAQNLGAFSIPDSFNISANLYTGWYYRMDSPYGVRVSDGSAIDNIPNAGTNDYWEIDNDPCRLTLGYPWRIPTRTEWEDLEYQRPDNDWDDLEEGYDYSGIRLAAGGILSDSGTLRYRTCGFWWYYDGNMNLCDDGGSSYNDDPYYRYWNGVAYLYYWFCSVRCVKTY